MTKQCIHKATGSATLELALVLPVFVMLVFGITEIGRALYQENTLTKAVTVGARFIAREPRVIDTACVPMGAWADATQAARLVIAFGREAAGEPLLLGLDDSSAVNIQVKAISAGGINACVIRVEARTPFAGLFGASVVPFMNLNNVQLNAVAEERYIGE